MCLLYVIFRLTISAFICCIFIVYIIFTWLRHVEKCQLVVKLYLSCIEHYIMRVMYEFELWATGDWRENVRKESHGSKPAFIIGGERDLANKVIFPHYFVYTLYILCIFSNPPQTSLSHRVQLSPEAFLYDYLKSDFLSQHCPVSEVCYLQLSFTYLRTKYSPSLFTYNFSAPLDSRLGTVHDHVPLSALSTSPVTSPVMFTVVFNSFNLCINRQALSII